MTDTAKGLHHDIGKRVTRSFNQSEYILPPEIFDTVACKDTQLAQQSKPSMYELWYRKQCSGYCGTGGMLRWWDKEANTRCPNCNLQVETADYLNCCGNPERHCLLTKHAEEIKERMKMHSMHPVLQQWILLYLSHHVNQLSVGFTESNLHITNKGTSC